MHIDCDTCPGRPRACDGCIMTLLVAPFEARASADVEVHRNEFEIDHELRLEAAVDTFRDAGMLRDRTPVSTVDRKTLPRSLSALPDTAVRRAG